MIGMLALKIRHMRIDLSVHCVGSFLLFLNDRLDNGPFPMAQIVCGVF